MNRVVTSREAILQVCRAMVSENGLQSINMRAVARRCSTALGSLYNYFPSKEELMAAAIESVWQDIFHRSSTCRMDMAFIDYVVWIFESVKQGAQQYPNFFTAHSISFASDEKCKARQIMTQYFQHMRSGMLEVLDDDENVRSDAFSDKFTRSDLVDFTLSSLLYGLAWQKDSCCVLTEMIRRSIY